MHIPKISKKINVSVDPNSRIQPLYAADGKNLDVLGSVTLTITLRNFNVQHEFHIVENLNHSVLLGMDFLQKTCCHIHLSSNYVSFYDGRIFLPLQTLHENSVILRATEFVTIPAKSQAFIPVKMAKNALSNFQTSVIVELHVKLTLNKVSVERMLVNKPSTGYLNCRVFNYDTQPKNIFRGISVAVITPLSESYGINHARTDSYSRSASSQQSLQSKHTQQDKQQRSSEHEQKENCQQTVNAKTAHRNSDSTQQQNKNSHAADRLTFTSGKTKDPFTLTDKINYVKSKNLLNDSQEIEPEIFPQFVDLLYEFRDIFAHSAKDITECNVMECELLLQDKAKPVRCRPYRLSDDMRKVEILKKQL